MGAVTPRTSPQWTEQIGKCLKFHPPPPEQKVAKMSFSNASAMDSKVVMRKDVEIPSGMVQISIANHSRLLLFTVLGKSKRYSNCLIPFSENNTGNATWIDPSVVQLQCHGSTLSTGPFSLPSFPFSVASFSSLSDSVSDQARLGWTITTRRCSSSGLS